LAPEITTVSNPKIKPARAAINEIPNKLAVDEVGIAVVLEKLPLFQLPVTSFQVSGRRDGV
jgi:hypothetical protein